MAPFRGVHYQSILKSGVYVEWYEHFLKRYILGKDDYPCVCYLHAPIGDIGLTLYSYHDLYTVQEIFGLESYRASSETIVIDFGSNIGVSAAYFLSRNPDVHVYCFEPVPNNADRLCANLEPFVGRYNLTRAAVTDHDGEVSFRTEPTGRYSGIDNLSGPLCTFPSLSADRVLREIISQHGHIDILKIDIEGAERLFFPTLPKDVLGHIRTIYIEGRDRFSPPGFTLDQPVHGVDRYRLIEGNGAT